VFLFKLHVFWKETLYRALEIIANIIHYVDYKFISNSSGFVVWLHNNYNSFLLVSFHNNILRKKNRILKFKEVKKILKKVYRILDNPLSNYR